MLQVIHESWTGFHQLRLFNLAGSGWSGSTRATRTGLTKWLKSIIYQTYSECRAVGRYACKVKGAICECFVLYAEAWQQAIGVELRCCLRIVIHVKDGKSVVLT